MKRIVKQLIIIISVLAVLTGIVWGTKWLLRVRPTCFDGIKNGEEEEIDCGIACGVICPEKKPEAKSLMLKSVQAVQGGGKCDIVGIVSNPNSTLGAEHIPYTIKWGTIEKQGEFYVYPSEERYLADVNLPCQSSGTPQLEIKDPPRWDFFKGYEKPNLEISNFKFTYPDDSYEFAEVTGIVINQSPFDLKEVEIYAIVKDSAGNITAINHTTVNGIFVGEKREFRIFWTHSFPKNGTGSFFITSNLFNSENFIKTYSAESAKWNTDELKNNYGRNQINQGGQNYLQNPK